MGHAIPWKSEDEELANELVEQTRRNNGLAPLDLEKFWAGQEVAKRDPFGQDIPQVPLGIMMSSECIPTELGVEVDEWRFKQDEEYALSLKKAYNDKAETIVGRRLLNETRSRKEKRFPAPKWLAEVFEGRYVWNAGSWWLEPAAENEEELKNLLDRVEQRLADLRDVILPEGWDDKRDELLAEGAMPPLYRGQRGPVTFATSIYGVENLLFLFYDNPDLADRFRDSILSCMLEIGRILDEEAGYTPDTAPRGFNFRDDNCALLTPEMYERFGYPILKGIFDQYAPDPDDRRFQHSDSAMSHLLPLLGKLDLTGTNFGPTVMVNEIREHLPNAVINGELAPFTFSRNEEANIVMEFLRDFHMIKESRGLRFATAGSINDGSLLTGMRLIMAAIQRYGRYGES